MPHDTRTNHVPYGLICACLAICMPEVVFPQEPDLRLRQATAESAAGDARIATLESGAEWTIDIAALMVSPAIAWPVGPNWRVGAGIGVGDDLLGFMAVGGNHYSEPGWWSYEDRDGATDKKLFDVLHAKVFARAKPSARWLVDIGLQASVFLHFDSSDDDPGSGLSVAGYVLPVYGWRTVKFGSRIAVGYFRGCGDAAEFGVKVSPVIFRVVFG